MILEMECWRFRWGGWVFIGRFCCWDLIVDEPTTLVVGRVIMGITGGQNVFVFVGKL